MKYFLPLLFCLYVSGCSHVKIPDFKAHITLPASGDGYWIKTVSNEEGRIPKAKWDELKKRGIVILSEDWQILRRVVMKNCLMNKSCQDTVGAFDSLFYSIDEALKVAK